MIMCASTVRYVANYILCTDLLRSLPIWAALGTAAAVSTASLTLALSSIPQSCNQYCHCRFLPIHGVRSRFMKLCSFNKRRTAPEPSLMLTATDLRDFSYHILGPWQSVG